MKIKSIQENGMWACLEQKTHEYEVQTVRPANNAEWHDKKNPVITKTHTERRGERRGEKMEKNRCFMKFAAVRTKPSVR